MTEVSDDKYQAVQDSRPSADVKLARDVREIFDHMLGDGRSVIDPSATIWTAEAGAELRARVGDDPIHGKSMGQWDKLDIQLSGAKRETVLLAAELVFLREYVLSNSRPETRLTNLKQVLANLDSPVTIPDKMLEWTARPAGRAGLKGSQGYYGGLWLHLTWAATFMIHWNSLGEDERVIARNSPWELQRVMLESGKDRSDIRNVLQFLACPDTFEAISSAEKKKKIRQALANRIGGATGDGPDAIDRDLFNIRAVLAEEISGEFTFWAPGIREVWDPPAPTADPEWTDEPRSRRYWMYSPGRQASKWDEFSSNELMAIGWDELGDPTEYESQEAIRQILAGDGSGSSAKHDALAVWQFQQEMRIGDIVYAKRGRQEIVGRGEVTSDARYEPDRESYRHVRSVNWTHKGSWPLSDSAPLKTLTDISDKRDEIDRLEALFTDGLPAEAPSTTEPLPTYTRQDFLEDVYISDSDYDRLRSLLLRKKNIILAGPPGVGKTFAARRLAHSIMGERDNDRIQMVQFHQSYSYEDFIMGYRPTEDGGFSLEEGPFYQFCEEARADDPSRPYFFIIDEINRGNISKIFGELLMLIEADKRGRKLRLLYKKEDFTVPPNVHIIGMMNTADRSLAVIDYALRRRFGFFTMTPAFDSEGFKAWKESVGSPALDVLVDTVVKLNSEIGADPGLGPGFKIGHSYLIKPQTSDADDEDWLFSVVVDELIPLLEEYWFDEDAKANEWANALRSALT